MNILCPLCNEKSYILYEGKQRYYQCKNCYGIFVDRVDLLDKDQEIDVYTQHDIDTDDKGYRTFVSPITGSILKDFRANHLGLDFGAGRSRIISAVLSDSDYVVENYDPLFFDDKKLLKQKYDFISSCEVIEHFFEPYKEFLLLKSMMKNGSKLYLMSEVYHDDIDFEKWYYKNDPTHVFFYHEKTFRWIQEEFGFSSVDIYKRLIIFENLKI